MSSALILHGYSSENAGDGLLVSETIGLVRRAMGPDVTITLIASRPDSFRDLQVATIDARPRWSGWDPVLRRCLQEIDKFDLVVGVGGGYLRGAVGRELLTTTLVHLPQLYAASRVPQTVYLPQSIGPFRYGTRPIVNLMLRRLGIVMVRDDRSLADAGAWARRTPDLAILSGGWRYRASTSGRMDIPVLSVRAVRGRLPDTVRQLVPLIPQYDSYIQSSVGANNDLRATSFLRPRAELTREDLFGSNSSPRVVVAVRLHAALMALQAGHYVVHLAYERKGYGAFDDLNLREYVHSAFTGSAATVANQVDQLLSDSDSRRLYDARLREARVRVNEERAAIVNAMRVLARSRTAAR